MIDITAEATEGTISVDVSMANGEIYTGTIVQSITSLTVNVPIFSFGIISFLMSTGEEQIAGIIEEESITVTLPFGTDITILEPVVNYRGFSISVSGVQDFTNQIVYTITTVTGYLLDYTVTVIVEESDSKDIAGFTIDCLLTTDHTVISLGVTQTITYGDPVTYSSPSYAVPYRWFFNGIEQAETTNTITFGDDILINGTYTDFPRITLVTTIYFVVLLRDRHGNISISEMESVTLTASVNEV